MEKMQNLYMQMYQNVDESVQIAMGAVMIVEIIKMSAKYREKNCFLLFNEDEFKKSKLDRMIDNILESQDTESIITLWTQIKKLNQDLEQLNDFFRQQEDGM